MRWTTQPLAPRDASIDRAGRLPVADPFPYRPDQAELVEGGRAQAVNETPHLDASAPRTASRSATRTPWSARPARPSPSAGRPSGRPRPLGRDPAMSAPEESGNPLTRARHKDIARRRLRVHHALADMRAKAEEITTASSATTLPCAGDPRVPARPSCPSRSCCGCRTATPPDSWCSTSPCGCWKAPPRTDKSATPPCRRSMTGTGHVRVPLGAVRRPPARRPHLCTRRHRHALGSRRRPPTSGPHRPDRRASAQRDLMPKVAVRSTDPHPQCVQWSDRRRRRNHDRAQAPHAGAARTGERAWTVATSPMCERPAY